jgi:hypothetical protein
MRTFLWRLEGREKQPLQFDVDGPALLLNGHIVSMDLSWEGAEPWLGSHEDVELSRVGSVTLSGREAMDGPVLGRLRGSGAVVDLTRYEAKLPKAVREAVLACDPRGLAVAWSPAAAELLSRAKNLEHLLADRLPGEVLPHSERLRTLVVEMPAPGAAASQPAEAGEGEPAPVSLEGLSRYRNLHVLYLGVPDRAVESYAPVAKLTRLRSFVTNGVLGEFALLSKLDRLEILALSQLDGVTEVSPLVRLTQLRRLMLLGLPKDVQRLDVLAELPYLQVVVLDNSLLEARGETIARIREARPELRIEGFCLGSRWVLAVVCGGLLLALCLRWARRRGRVCAAA